MSKNKTLPELYSKFKQLNQRYREAEYQQKVKGPDDPFVYVEIREAWHELKSCMKELDVFRQQKLEELDRQIASGSDLPHTIITWFEDEGDDLWAGLG